MSTHTANAKLQVGASLTMSLAAASALALAVTLAPPRSGPNCLTDECMTYPYTDIAAYASTDYWWMYPAAMLPMAFVVALVSFRESVPPDRHAALWLALCSAVASSIVLGMTYAIQLMVVLPSLDKGEAAALTLWSQYNPHGLFIALENVGYLFAGLALLALSWTFPGRRGLDRALRWWSRVCGTIGVLGLPVLAMLLRLDLEYQYEVLSLLAAWVGLLVLGVLLALRRRYSPPPAADMDDPGLAPESSLPAVPAGGVRTG